LCQTFQLVSGYVFFDINLWTARKGSPVASLLPESFGYLANLVIQNQGYVRFNEVMHSASVSSILLATRFPGINATALNEKIKGTIRNNCTVSYRNSTKHCALIFFLTASLGIKNQVSDYHYNLPAGACADTFTIPSIYWYVLLFTSQFHIPPYLSAGISWPRLLPLSCCRTTTAATQT
jgi:hypothetical protein